MVSGFHGNVDPIMVCLLLVATYFCVEENLLLSAMFLAFSVRNQNHSAVFSSGIFLLLVQPRSKVPG